MSGLGYKILMVYICRSSCAWHQMFRLYSDSLVSCKLYLSSALSQPILNLLTKDEWFFDIEASKVMERFQPNQRASKFGLPGKLVVNKPPTTRH